MSTPPGKYWFPAKRCGWGWGFPTCWQGWLVFAAYFGLFILGVAFLRGNARPAEFIMFVSVITLALLLICWKKGEPPRWRWGGD
jgi:hypothetical protein